MARKSGTLLLGKDRWVNDIESLLWGLSPLEGVRGNW